ncbi:MAG: fumarate hydratase [Desulfatiglandales bacterium]
MREIRAEEIVEAVRQGVIKANYELGDDTIDAFQKALVLEESPAGKEVIKDLLLNATIAREERIPLCQDTGLVVIFLEIGQEVHIKGALKEAIEEGVRRGYQEGYLRKSLCHPLTRKNTGDNTPVVIHTEFTAGDGFRMWVVPKGGGSENMSRIYMLPPSAGKEGIIEKVAETVADAGPNPCPPTIVGVGIGGNFEMAALLAKKALLRKVGEPNPDLDLAELEKEMLTRINNLGIGPQGLGGRVTSLAVHVLMMPCHIASLPLGINIQCHANRHVEIIL